MQALTWLCTDLDTEVKMAPQHEDPKAAATFEIQKNLNGAVSAPSTGSQLKECMCQRSEDSKLGLKREL
jgi:hypothetical protein